MFSLSPISDYTSGLTSRPRDLEKIVDVTHNSVTKQALTLNQETTELWVHRKGAAPADKGVTPCPGSRGHFSWLLRPMGDGQYNGQSSETFFITAVLTVPANCTAHSLAHGAGRRYGRNVLHGSRSKFSKSNLITTSLGSEVVCSDPDLLIEERPEAYKDVGCVVSDMEVKEVCKGVVVLRPVVTYKVRTRGEARK